MAKVKCLNPIAACGMDLLPEGYNVVEDLADADVVLVRSAAMHDLELPADLKAIARAGAGVNNIPLDKCAEQGIVCRHRDYGQEDRRDRSGCDWCKGCQCSSQLRNGSIWI